VNLEEWIRGIEKIFIVMEVSNGKKVNIEMFYLIREVGIWWNTVNDMLLGPDFTWNKFLKELRTKFYPVMIQR